MTTNDRPPFRDNVRGNNPQHRFFLADFFTGTGDDVVVIRKGVALLDRPLPDGLEELAEHNLITFKSHRQALDAWAIKELIGHYVNVSTFQDSESLFRILDLRHFAVNQVLARPLLYTTSSGAGGCVKASGRISKVGGVLGSDLTFQDSESRFNTPPKQGSGCPRRPRASGFYPSTKIKSHRTPYQSSSARHVSGPCPNIRSRATIDEHPTSHSTTRMPCRCDLHSSARHF